MLKRSIQRVIWTSDRSRISSKTLRPLFKPAGGVSEFANIEGATLKPTPRENVLEFKSMISRVASDRGAYYYLGVTTLAGIIFFSVYDGAEKKRIRDDGLVGPKRKSFNSRLTVVLDVDETLLSYGDKAFRLKAGVVPRPYLAELLDYLARIDAEVILWSACSQSYMNEILSVIDPTQEKISRTITKNANWFTGDNYYEKNVHWLKRNPDDVIIVENRALAVRGCNANAILVDDFIRGEYVDTGVDLPRNDTALLTVRQIIEDLQTSGLPVAQYLADAKVRSTGIKEIPCERAIRQLRDEIARGVFYFVGDKYLPDTNHTARIVAPTSF